ncbi:CotD family spore coat protein [Ectobacillus polymachus]|uniref:CotD family spore coat protein n=1 Tax=Ectobacillus polymachus TaxID=1508806 RepID=UPI003A836361
MYCKSCMGGPSFVSPVATGPVMTTPPVVHPTKHCVTNTFSTTVVPHIHPTHSTLINHQMIQNQHYFPQTQSAYNTVQQTNVPGYGPSPLVAGAMTGPFAPVSPYGGPSPMVAGAMAGPGMPYGPGSQVAGAMTGPGMPYGPGSQVAGAMTGPGMPYGANMGPNANPMLGGMHK